MVLLVSLAGVNEVKVIAKAQEEKDVGFLCLDTTSTHTMARSLEHSEDNHDFRLGHCS